MYIYSYHVIAYSYFGPMDASYLCFTESEVAVCIVYTKLYTDIVMLKYEQIQLLLYINICNLIATICFTVSNTL